MSPILGIDIDPVISVVLHPHVKIRRYDLAPHVPSNLNTQGLSLTGIMTVLEAQETLTITAMVLFDKLIPCVRVLLGAMVVWCLCDNYHYDENHLGVHVDLPPQFRPQAISILGESAFDKERDFWALRVHQGCEEKTEIGGGRKPIF